MNHEPLVVALCYITPDSAIQPPPLWYNGYNATSTPLPTSRALYNLCTVTSGKIRKVDPYRHQNLIDWFLAHAPHLQKFHQKTAHNFLDILHTDTQTNRHAHTQKQPPSFGGGHKTSTTWLVPVQRIYIQRETHRPQIDNSNLIIQNLYKTNEILYDFRNQSHEFSIYDPDRTPEQTWRSVFSTLGSHAWFSAYIILESPDHHHKPGYPFHHSVTGWLPDCQQELLQLMTNWRWRRCWWQWRWSVLFDTYQRL